MSRSKDDWKIERYQSMYENVYLMILNGLLPTSDEWETGEEFHEFVNGLVEIAYNKILTNWREIEEQLGGDHESH